MFASVAARLADKNKAPDAAETFKDVAAAYEVLSDGKSRFL